MTTTVLVSEQMEDCIAIIGINDDSSWMKIGTSLNMGRTLLHVLSIERFKLHKRISIQDLSFPTNDWI